MTRRRSQPASPTGLLSEYNKHAPGRRGGTAKARRTARRATKKPLVVVDVAPPSPVSSLVSLPLVASAVWRLSRIAVRRNARCRGSVACASPGGRNGGPHCNADALCFVTFCAAAVGAFCVTEVIFLLGVPELICSSCSWKRGHSPPLFTCARLSRLIASVTAPFAVAVGRA